MHTLHDLFTHDLQDLYDAERQITKALPKMIQAASSPQLKKGFEKHLEQTKQQLKRLEKIHASLDIKMNGVHCKGMEGLLKESDTLLQEEADPEVLDAALIAAAQKVEHYEIAAYGTAVTWAKRMKHTEEAKLLAQTLDEEEKTDKKLSELAEKKINQKANSM